MDSGNGDFASISEEKAKTLTEALQPFIEKGKIKGSGIFRIGEEVELKGSRFTVLHKVR